MPTISGFQMWLGGALLAFGFFNLAKTFLFYRKIKISESWIETKGTITSASVEFSNGPKGGRSYWASFGYSYRVDGDEHVGKFKMESFGSWLGGKGDAEKLVAEHPVGSKLVVRYNPEKPGESISEYDRLTRLLLVKSLMWLVFATIMVMLPLSNPSK